MNHPWTDNDVERLRRLWDEGHSGGVIAREFGISRNAVIGKAYRLGLPQRTTLVRNKTTTVFAERSPWRASKPKPPKREPKKTFTIGPDPRAPRYVEIIPEDQRVSLLDLEASHCRFPFGEGREITFCGRQRVTGLPYCLSHARSAYTEARVPLNDPQTQEQSTEKSRELEGVA